MPTAPLLHLAFSAALLAAPPADSPEFFRTAVAPVLEQHCLSCHNSDAKKAGLSLETRAAALTGGEHGPAIVPGDPDASRLARLIALPYPKMPKKGELKPEQVAAIRAWIAAGAVWPADLVLHDRPPLDATWWSLQPLHRPAPPAPSSAQAAAWRRTPIDAFIHAALDERGLSPSPEADRRTLIRRLTFDLTGLPPTPEAIDRFLADPRPDAYEHLVDQLLASPAYGERWARHWLDLVHYGDTHGYDKDKPRPNAWAYRDYVIRSLNDDKPYARFLQEQIAGDVLFPDSSDGLVAMGFLAAGPWDHIGHVEVPETKIDGMIARHLDRDDMVQTALGTFNSLTVSCAQCHNHKFDPITQEDYYSLQAVFAALDRADRKYHPDPAVTRRLAELERGEALLITRQNQLEAQLKSRLGPSVAALDKQIDALLKASPTKEPAEHGYHSAISKTPDAVKWVQIDLGRPAALTRLTWIGCYDRYKEIGAGFGFPVRYRIEACDEPSFTRGVRRLLDRTDADVENPGTVPQTLDLAGVTARFIRITATKLAPRSGDYIFALAEVEVYDTQGFNVAKDAEVTALDSIEAGVRWGKRNLIDGIYAVSGENQQKLAALQDQRRALIEQLAPADLRAELADVQSQLMQIKADLAALPPPRTVYTAAVHHGTGNFKGTGASGGKPRPIHVLRRGDVKTPLHEVAPGAITAIAAMTGLPGRFDLAPDDAESARRAALARWLSDPRNPLTWRSIVNRVWQHHFGRALVATPNDFGRMGALPTHPELLDYLAAEFREGRQSLKDLHRLIVTSAVYRQTSAPGSSAAAAKAAALDADNTLLWRMNRRRLEAEAIRDAVLAVSGRLDPRMHGPAYQDFIIEHPQHSPHYQYHLHDPDDPATHRRSIYRFIVRSQTQPFMTTLDCADPSMQVEKRNESLSALQALALLNNSFMTTMSRHFAHRLEAMTSDAHEQLRCAFRLALGREASSDEAAALSAYAQQHGIANACRVILNLNAFVFVD